MYILKYNWFLLEESILPRTILHMHRLWISDFLFIYFWVYFRFLLPGLFFFSGKKAKETDEERRFIRICPFLKNASTYHWRVKKGALFCTTYSQTIIISTLVFGSKFQNGCEITRHPIRTNKVNILNDEF
jgi:hypothetical protein